MFNPARNQRNHGKTWLHTVQSKHHECLVQQQQQQRATSWKYTHTHLSCFDQQQASITDTHKLHTSNETANFSLTIALKSFTPDSLYFLTIE